MSIPAISEMVSVIKAERVQVLDFGQSIASGIPHHVLNNPVVMTAYLGTAEEDLADA